MKNIVIENSEKYLKESFKNIRISNIERITLDETQEKDDYYIIKYAGDYNILRESFINIEEVLIGDSFIKFKNNIVEEEIREIIDILNVKIDDFNIYAKDRKPISFF